MTSSGPEDGGTLPVAGAAFLIAQIGAHAANMFAGRAATLGLTPPQTGLLRLIAMDPGRTQQAVAEQLGIQPSRVVAIVDELEANGLLERRRSVSDRRQYALHLTDRGGEVLREVARVSAEHEADISTALTPAEHRRLTALLTRIADQQGLTPGVHPGYRRLNPGISTETGA